MHRGAPSGFLTPGGIYIPLRGVKRLEGFKMSYPLWSTKYPFPRFFSMEQITVKVPETLDDVTLEQYQRLMVAAKEEDAEVKEVAYINIVYDLTPGTIARIPKTKREELRISIERLLALEPPITLKFELNGVRYGFTPDLERLTAGEWVDLESLGFDNANLHKVMAILYRPIIEHKGDSYLIAPYTGRERSDHFRGSPASIAVGALLFFCRLGLDCMSATPRFLERTPTGTQPGETLVKSGAGTTPSPA